MRFGAHSMMWTASFREDDLEIFDKLDSFNFDSLEILLDDPEALPVKGIQNKMDETGMEIAGSVTLDEEHNAISPDKEVRDKAVEYLKDRIKIASKLGAPVVSGVTYAGWGYFTGKPRSEEEIKRSKEVIWQVTDLLEETGVTLGVEAINRFETHFLNTAEQAKKFVDQIDHPNVKIHLDTYHMNIEEKDFYEPIKLVGDDLCHVHLCENDRGVPGTGHVNWNEVFRALDEVDYENMAIVESFVPEIEEVAQETAIWRKVAPGADELAKQALEFFKKNTNS